MTRGVVKLVPLLLLAACGGAGAAAGAGAASGAPAGGAESLPSNQVSADAVVAPADAGVDAAPGSAQDGEQVYRRKGCIACHSIDGSQKVGPSWKGLFGSQQRLKGGRTVVVDAAYVRRSVLDPTADLCEGYNPVMPTFKGQLSDGDIANLVAFIASLR